MDPLAPFSFDLSYCGVPPSPAELWTRWNLDPVLLAGLALAALAGHVLLRRARLAERAAFAGGLIVIAIAFVTPLCAMANALFSARTVHHVLLVAAAAPLLAFAGRRQLSQTADGRLVGPAFLVHLAVFWLWHVPGLYAAALADPAVYWLMQLSLLASATVMWVGIWSASRGPAVAALLGSVLQMGMLAALLVFAREPLYHPHQLTTAAFGLDALSDQQLAGLLMWVPAALPYLAAALFLTIGSLQPRWSEPAR